MAQGKDRLRQAAFNKQDITDDTSGQRKDFEREIREKQTRLQDSHKKEKQSLFQQHGQDVSQIVKECAEEHPIIQEARINRCAKNFERERDALQNVHERVEMYQEVRSKSEWEKSFPSNPYPSKSNEALIEARQKQLLEKAQDPKADKVAIHQELEHDQLVLSYMEDKIDHAEFRKEYETMLKNHMSESLPTTEVELNHRHPKAPDMDKD